MRKILLASVGLLAAGLVPNKSSAQITLLKDYKNNSSPAIGTFQGINFREAGFSTLFYIPGTNGKEFWTCSDRGVNVDDASANPTGCQPTYDKMYAFPSYAPKIHRIRINGDSVQILRTISMKRPNGTGATGIINPTGLGSTAAEQASTDTVLDCANFLSKIAAKDTFGIDPEGLVVDKAGNFWVCEEGGPCVWKLNQNGKLIKRYTPYANLGGKQAVDVAIDTVFKYRKNNRGFENIAITPNGKIYVMIQSPILFPDATTGQATRVHRLLEIDPVTDATRMFAYLNDGAVGGSGQVRMQDWKFGDMAAINDSTFLIIEAAARGTTDLKRIYMFNINGATQITAATYGGLTLEALVDSTGLAGKSINPIKKTFFMDLLAKGWPSALDKSEGLTIIDDSTIAVCNDNDFGQTSPSANGIATATTNVSHVLVFRLQGADKLKNFKPLGTTLDLGVTGPNSSQAPYLVPTLPNVKLTSIITAGDSVYGYKMAGLPDGLGAFDNNDGTFTVVMNHELGGTAGAIHAWGNTGAFVSKWIIRKSDLSVVSGSDLTQRVNLWNPTTSTYTTYFPTNPSSLVQFNRFCSADLPAVSAFYNKATGLGTQARIFMNGEENGSEGRGMAHIITGAEAGTDYELPYLGKFSWENALANPATGDKTVVAGTDDATPGQVYFYVGNKQSTGNEIEKAGLTDGKLYGPAVTGMLTEANTLPISTTTPTAFTMVDLGKVQSITGSTLETNSNNAGVTRFLRPEDGAWDPQHPEDFYFNTTNAFGSPSRLWKMHFSDINNIPAGGTIVPVLDGTEGQQMLDNLTIDNSGHILLVEDVGGNAHLGKVWQYDIATDALKQIATHDSTRFLNGSANFLTQDEEASGILDVQEILGAGMFLTVDQAHYGIPSPIVEGGQLLALYNPDSYNAVAEISVAGNGINISKGDVTPTAADNTDFGNLTTGNTISKSFVITNAGPGPLTVSGITITGASASEFTLTGAPTFPLTIAAAGTQTINVQFAPTVVGLRTATLTINNSDLDEKVFDFAVQGVGLNPIPSTGIGSQASPSFARLYPNPTSNEATVSVTLTKDERVSLQVFDMQGKLVIPAIERSMTTGEQEIKFNTSELTNGMYFVQLSAGSVTTKMKMVIAH